MNKENFRVLVVDDEHSFLTLLTRILEDEGYTVKGVKAPEEAMKAIDSFAPSLVITDLKMPTTDGITFMEQVRRRNEEIDFIVITAYATVETAVSALKKGALDYITKPLRDPEQLRLSVAKVFERQGLITENVLLKSGVFADMPPTEILFGGIERVLQEIRDVAPTDATVILYGETGTGKSLIAKVVHHMSGRSGPFVEINCAAIPETLLESELFGYEKGAFTGAQSQKRGKFEVANDGTVFLDEISEMSLTLQAKLLRVIQDRTFERLGSLSTMKTSARIIAATNRNLRELVSEKKFREDLYYRLNVFPISIAPLRERKEYLGRIADYLVETISARLGKGKKRIPQGSVNRLVGYPWPGNIRELENILERSIIISRGEELEIPDLGFPGGVGDRQQQQEPEDLRTLEKIAIEKTLVKTGGNRKHAAELLGISLRALQYKIREYDLTK